MCSLAAKAEPVRQIEESPVDQQPPTNRERELSQSQLARRLNLNSSTIMRAKNKGAEYFRDWSRSKDPQGVGWRFNPKNQRYMMEVE